ncbi:MAG: hypothetical protein WC916_02395 [Candidatus Woesearchaeota archaeon]
MADLKNNSMMEDYRRLPENNFLKQLRRNPMNPGGCETPVGHTYALILEELAKEKIMITPSITGFIEFIDAHQELYNRRTTVFTSTYHPSITLPVDIFMRMNLISKEGRIRVLKEILGPTHEYALDPDNRWAI